MENELITEIAFTKSKLPWGWLGNMSRCIIIHEELEWKSTEALFQAMRFPEDSPIREEIRLASNGFTAKLVAKAKRDEMSIRPCSKEDYDNMRFCIRLKIEQHSDLKQSLIASTELPIYEDVTARGRDKSNLIWGAIKHEDGTWEGLNMMGNLWEELREELRENIIELIIHDKFEITGRGTVLIASMKANNLTTTEGLVGKELVYESDRYLIRVIEAAQFLVDPPKLADNFGMLVRKL